MHPARQDFGRSRIRESSAGDVAAVTVYARVVCIDEGARENELRQEPSSVHHADYKREWAVVERVCIARIIE